MEIEGIETKSFINKDEALLYLFDNGVKTYQYYTKLISEYTNTKQIPIYELWHIGNRIGYVLDDYEPYIDESNAVQYRKSFVWRFVGYGMPCFAADKETLAENVLKLIDYHKNDPEDRGLNEYPYFTKCYR